MALLIKNSPKQIKEFNLESLNMVWNEVNSLKRRMEKIEEKFDIDMSLSQMQKVIRDFSNLIKSLEGLVTGVSVVIGNYRFYEVGGIVQFQKTTDGGNTWVDTGTQLP